MLKLIETHIGEVRVCSSFSGNTELCDEQVEPPFFNVDLLKYI